MMTMTDTGDPEVGVMKGDGLEVVLLITAIEDPIVPESKCVVGVWLQPHSSLWEEKHHVAYLVVNNDNLLLLWGVTCGSYVLACYVKSEILNEIILCFTEEELKANAQFEKYFLKHLDMSVGIRHHSLFLMYLFSSRPTGRPRRSRSHSDNDR